jgi:hypothetical protein
MVLSVRLTGIAEVDGRGNRFRTLWRHRPGDGAVAGLCLEWVNTGCLRATIVSADLAA